MIVKKLILLFLTSFFFISLVSAGIYGDGFYGAENYSINTAPPSCGDGICNGVEDCSTCSADCGICPSADPPGGGSGSSCSYEWKCSDWFPSICPESGEQERICVNKGTCRGLEEIPEQTMVCEYTGPGEPLFDIFLTLSDESKELCSGEKISAKIKLENYGKVELLDAFMTYWVVDEYNTLISEVKDTRAVEEEKEFDVELDIPVSSIDGTYKVYAQINYDVDKTAVAGESFEIVSGEKCVARTFKFIGFKYIYLLYLIIVLVLILVIFLLIKRLKKVKRKIKPRGHFDYVRKVKSSLRRIRRKSYLVALVGIIIFGMFAVGNSLTGYVINESNAGTARLSVIGFIVIVGILGSLFFVYRKRLIRKLEDRRVKKYPKDSVKGLVKKKVYSGLGDYMGRIKEVMLENNRIDSLMVRLGKNRKKTKTAVVKYKDFEAVGDIAIVDTKVSDYLDNLDKDGIG